MPGLAISTSFQIDSVVLIDMAYEIDPNVPVFSVDTGRLPAETLELADRLRDRYPGLQLELVEPDPDEIATHDRQARRGSLQDERRPAPALLQPPQGPAR